MRFKVKETAITISFSFFALLLLWLVEKNNGVLGVCLACSVIHELVHLLFILLFGAGLKSISFSFFGGEIKRAENLISPIKEGIISISAPVFNIIIGSAFLKINNQSTWGIVNLLMGLFNIMPYESFDGGRFLYYILQDKISEAMLNKLIIVSSFVVCISFLALNGYMIMINNENILFLCLSVFLLILLVFRLFSRDNQGIYYL